MPQEELANLADLDRTTISGIERQVFGASIDTVARLAKALGVEPIALLVKSSR